MEQAASILGTESNILDCTGLCLLSLDGGGVRGLSTLYILKIVMDRLNHELKKNNQRPKKPCEVFDLIGGTSTGGLIAIMLGRLEMDVDQCIAAYSELAESVFSEKLRSIPFGMLGQTKARFSSAKLKQAIRKVIVDSGRPESELFDDSSERGCKTFVCTADRFTKDIVRLRSYILPEELSIIRPTICEAALATSAATTFFEPVSIGRRSFADGALGANNPVTEVEGEAINIWCSNEAGERELKPLIKCFVSIGTGNPGKKAFEDGITKFLGETVVEIATDTENIAKRFIALWAKQFDERRYFRFNVDQGLQDVGLEEYKKRGDIEAATEAYLVQQAQKSNVRYCIENLILKQNTTTTSFAVLIREHIVRTIRLQPDVHQPSHNIPFLRNRRFIGRSTILEELEQRLFIDMDTQQVAVVGLGGIGKTQTVLELAYRVQEGWPDYSIFWMPALSMESMEQAYSEIARTLKMPQATEDEDVKELVKQYLSSNAAGRWLLIVDNADDSNLLFGEGQQAQGIIDYLPQSESGLIMFTTRYQEVAAKLAGSDVIELEEMNDQEAVTFLEKSLASNSVARKQLFDNTANVTELLDELAHLPLAIAQAAAYLSRNKNLSITGYLQLLQRTDQELIRLLNYEFRDTTRYRDSTRYRDKNTENAVAKTWLISFKQIREHDEVAADLLSFISCIESKAIPRSILPSVKSEERMVEAIGTLCGYSFIVDRGNQDMYDTHRLVHLAIGKWIEDNGSLSRTVKEAVQHVSTTFPIADFANQAICRDYLTHAFRLLAGKVGENFEARYTLCLKVGRYLYYEGRISESVRWTRESCEWMEANLAEEHPHRLASQHQLAVVYEADGQIPKAVELMEQVVRVQARVYRKDHPDRLVSESVLHYFHTKHLDNLKISESQRDEI